jgi:hypothetical protein
MEMKALFGATFAAALVAVPAAAQAQQVGDWVLAPWQDSVQVFPGVVSARSGNAVTIRFNDGTVETRLADELRPFDWTTGTPVECQWTDGNWYAAHILMMGNDGLSMLVRYDDDGVEQKTRTGRCRSPN